MSGKRVAIYISSVALAALLVFGVYKFVSTPSLKPGSFETAVVERGNVIDFVPATGVVLPGSEVLILCPEASIIKKIVMEPGSHVEAGQPIIILDPKPIQDQIESLKDQLEVKHNNLHKNLLNSRSIKIDLEYNVEVKKLKIASLKAKVVDQKQLLEVGGLSPSKFDQTKQELVLAEKDLQTVLEKNSIRLEQLQTDKEGLKLQIGIQEKELADKEELLKRMVVKAPSAGIILQIYGKMGERISKHSLLVKLSDLSAFKIEGSIEEKLAGNIEVGTTVYILIDYEKLYGQIGNISPEVKNNRIEFDVFLKNSNHDKLLPNMSVDLWVVKNERDSVLRVKRGPAVENEVEEFDVYMVKSGFANRKRITTGLKGTDCVEIISGANEGDEVIISDIPLFRNIEKIVIQ